MSSSAWWKPRTLDPIIITSFASSVTFRHLGNEFQKSDACFHAYRNKWSILFIKSQFLSKLKILINSHGHISYHMLPSYMLYCENQKNRRGKAVLSKCLSITVNENMNSYTQWLCVTSRQKGQSPECCKNWVLLWGDSFKSFSLSTDLTVSERLS